MASYATKSDVQEIVNKAVDDLSEVINQLAQNIHGELAEVKVDLTEIKTDIADLKASYDKLLNTLDAFLKRLDDIETDNTARDAQIARLERWVEQIAAKTGTKLEY